MLHNNCYNINCVIKLQTYSMTCSIFIWKISSWRKYFPGWKSHFLQSLELHHLPSFHKPNRPAGHHLEQEDYQYRHCWMQPKQQVALLYVKRNWKLSIDIFYRSTINNAVIKEIPSCGETFGKIEYPTLYIDLLKTLKIFQLAYFNQKILFGIKSG